MRIDIGVESSICFLSLFIISSALPQERSLSRLPPSVLHAAKSLSVRAMRSAWERIVPFNEEPGK
jgi:hypothetical protein